MKVEMGVCLFPDFRGKSGAPHEFRIHQISIGMSWRWGRACDSVQRRFELEYLDQGILLNRLFTVACDYDVSGVYMLDEI